VPGDAPARGGVARAFVRDERGDEERDGA